MFFFLFLSACYANSMLTSTVFSKGYTCSLRYLFYINMHGSIPVDYCGLGNVWY